MQDLIDCFPDEDEHLMKFCQWHPKGMTVQELLTILQCPPSGETQREVERGEGQESQSESESESERYWILRARQTDSRWRSSARELGETHG